MQKLQEAPLVPFEVRNLQAQCESNFMGKKAVELELLKVRKGQSFMFVKPAKPSKITRAMVRFIPQIKRSYYYNIISRSGFFDEEWYLNKYPDVGLAAVDPLRHFIVWGGADLRDPGPYFSSVSYYRQHPEISDAGINPLIHYLMFGWDEDRIAQPSSLEHA